MENAPAKNTDRHAGGVDTQVSAAGPPASTHLRSPKSRQPGRPVQQVHSLSTRVQTWLPWLMAVVVGIAAGVALALRR